MKTGDNGTPIKAEKNLYYPRDGGAPSEEEQFAAAMQALKALYDQNGADAVREQLRAANVPDEVIEQ